MAGTTTRLEIPYCTGSDSPPDVPLYVQGVAEALDDAAMYSQGAASAKPGAGVTPDGWLYFETDTGILKVCDGSAWQSVTPSEAAAGVPSLRKIGTGATDVVAGNDSRLTDTRTPTNGSVAAAQIAGSLKPSGTAVASDEALRALGTSASTACAGNDSRLTNQRVPSAGSVSPTKLSEAMRHGLASVVGRWSGILDDAVGTSSGYYLLHSDGNFRKGGADQDHGPQVTQMRWNDFGGDGSSLYSFLELRAVIRTNATDPGSGLSKLAFVRPTNGTAGATDKIRVDVEDIGGVWFNDDGSGVSSNFEVAVNPTADDLLVVRSSPIRFLPNAFDSTWDPTTEDEYYDLICPAIILTGAVATNSRMSVSMELIKHRVQGTDVFRDQI